MKLMEIPSAKGVINTWIIEDHNDTRVTIKNILDNTRGIICPFAFENCESAFEMIESYEGRARPWSVPDVILLDIVFGPGEMSGIEAIGMLKTKFLNVHIVMLTFRDDASSIYESLQKGASGYLLKEAKIDDIINAVRQASIGAMLMPASVARKVLGFFTSDKIPTGDKYGLSKREKEVLKEMEQGFTQKEIGERLYITSDTVNTHIQRIYKKLHVHCAPKAVSIAIRERLID